MELPGFNIHMSSIKNREAIPNFNSIYEGWAGFHSAVPSNSSLQILLPLLLYHNHILSVFTRISQRRLV